MTTSTIPLLVLAALVLLFFSFRWLIHTFASMNPEEQKAFEDEINKGFDDKLAKKALKEIELRNKVKDITDE